LCATCRAGGRQARILAWLSQVLRVRKLYAKGNVTQTVLADRSGSSLSSVKNILARRSWNTIARRA
jgi:ParB-like chromosome segregation protein Spo0J